MQRNWHNIFNKKNTTIIVISILVLTLGCIGIYIYKHFQFKKTAKIISYEECLKKLDEGFIYKLEVDKDIVYVYETSQNNLNSLIDKKNDKNCNLYCVKNIKDTKDLMNKISEHTKIAVTEDTIKSTIFTLILLVVLPISVFGGLAIRQASKTYQVVVSKNKKKGKKITLFEKRINNITGVTFDDVAGCDEAKESLVEMVDFLKNPKKYSKIGAKLPKGALMVGSPGCGKAVCYDTKIITPTGYKLAKDIKVGDIVYDGNGEKTEVLGVYPQGKLEVYRITFKDGTYVEVSLDHINRVYEGKTEQKDMLTSELIEYYKKNKEYNHWIKRPMNIEHKQQEYTKIECISKEGYEEECVCFMVASSDHTYLVNDFIPTHNTLLGKAVAGEAGVPFLYKSASEFVEMYVGVGAKRVRELFSEAKTNAPCIVFIDEIDAIGKARNNEGTSNDSEKDQTLNQLLTEMDGFATNNGIIVLGATNRPEILDKALLRPGRFDRRIEINAPDYKGRVEILKVHSKDVKLEKNVDLKEIALQTSGCSGADLANTINEAAILAVKDKRKRVSQKDLKEAIEIVLVGKKKKDRVLSEKDKKIVSYHEVGHALVTALLTHTEPIQKITIIPRTNGALGFVMQSPEEEKYLNSKNEILERIITCLGGRAAEEIIFGDITTGASNDIEKATQMAYAMVTQYGMNEKFGLMGLASTTGKYLGNGTKLNCSPETATEIDNEVKKILKDCYNKAKKILLDNKDKLKKLAEYLYKEETLTGKEFMQMLGEFEKK